MEEISLVKGAKVDLEKQAPGIHVFGIGCGWDPQSSVSSQSFDLDVSVMMLGENGKMRTGKDLVFFNNLKSPCGSVIHEGDNLTGDGEGDDEVVWVDTAKVPADVKEMLFVINIYQGESKRQNFGQVKNSFIRVFDKASTGPKNGKGLPAESIVRYDLNEDFSVETGITIGRLYRHNGVWKFEAVGTGERGGLDTYKQKYAA